MTAALDSAGNVTPLNRKREEKPRATRASVMLDHCLRTLREHVQQALPGMIDAIDDALYDLADTSESNKLQTVYFEAMRSLRLCREEMKTTFLRELDAEMRRKRFGGNEPRSSLSGSEFSAERLKLVDQDELEESVAVKNIAGKIRNLCHDDLFALDRRMALLLGRPTLEGEENPLAPEVLCNAARAAVSFVEAGVDVRLVVLKLFDRHLSHAATHVYPQINAWLVRQGVLPDVRARVAERRAGGPRRGPSPRRPGEGDGEAGVQRWGEGASSSAGWEHYHGDVVGQGTGGGAMPRSGAGPRVASSAGAGAARGGDEVTGAWNAGPAGAAPALTGIRGEQLLGLLEQVMRVGGAAALEGDGASAGREQLICNLTALQREGDVTAPHAAAGDCGANHLHALRTSGAAHGVSHADGLMIDVVAMMFDFILEDASIGDAMRALIARLQIPVLKVAILDKSFFARRSHPARSFVNTLAAFGARGAGAGADDPGFQRIQALVGRILEEFETELDVFSGASEELETIIAEEDAAAKESAWTSSKVSEERQRRQRARRRADEEVEARIADGEPPEVVGDFLRTHWRALLAERLLRDGENGESWRSGVQTMDQLLWSITPKHESIARGRLVQALPFLLECLKTGMQELALDPEVRDGFLRRLSKLHIATLRGEALDSAAVEPVTGDESATPVPAGESCDAPAADAGASATVPATVADDAPPRAASADAVLREAVERANAEVFRTAEERPQCQGMGTTVVALMLDGDALACAHVGDSRLYRVRAGSLEQLSRDHTYRQDVIDKGLQDAAEAAQIASNLITRAVGADDTVEVDVGVHHTLAGDLYLCCSDGLNDMLDDARIAELASAEGALECIARSLVDAANEAGGKDNVSVGLLRIAETLPCGEGSGPRDYADFVEVVSLTDPGRRRAHNEDAIEADAGCGAIVLADGMGGHNAGEVASAMTVRLVLDAVRAARAPSPEQAPVVVEGEAGFDFDAINATFWDDAVPDERNAALHAAVSAEVASAVLADGDELAVFDLDTGESMAAAGFPAPGVAEDAARDPLLERMLHVGCGTWVEFGDEAGKGRRARLSWVASDRTRFLFTDRYGQKVCESSPYGLALELRAGRLRMLDAVPMFDRAISAMADRLRGLPSSAGGDGEGELSAPGAWWPGRGTR